MLGYAVVEIDSPRAGARRYGLDGCGGRMELDARPEVFVRDYHTKAKGYPGANHFRLLNVDMNRISAALAANPALGGFLLGPYENGSSFLYGPTNETPECFDLTQFGKTMASMGPK